ncbi:MAG: ATP-binding cassette domain-containing protein [Bacteroidetes bacterium]|nr:ATP-binding cassette domain-containing protein [Bacteroidota bacterium]
MLKNNTPIIQIKNASICQGDNFILENITFNIFQGEFCFLIGKTGSGKSSLLKTIYADIQLKHGEGYVTDFDLRELTYEEIPNLRRRLGIIFQDFQLLTDRSVEENLLFVLKATGWDDKISIRHRISEVLMKVGMDWSLKKMPHQLSGGEQQRIVIARALLNDPLILLADEPTGNLDPEVGEEVLSLFFEINKMGTAVLMATHNYQFVEKYPRRIIKCQEGKILV